MQQPTFVPGRVSRSGDIAFELVQRGVDGETAWRRSIANNASVWDASLDSPHFIGSVRNRLAEGYATPGGARKFALRERDAFFCIGSCFARVLERHLRYRNLDVTSMLYHGEHGDPGIGANAVNKYTTASIVNELRWSLAGEPYPEHALIPHADGYCDLQLREGMLPVSLERALERRRELHEYFARLRLADVVIITLGLVELWYDNVASVWLNATPPFDVVCRFPGRFSVHASTFARSRVELEEALNLLAEHGPAGQRVILTVSPVPMHRTFVEDDVLAASGYAKAVLRAVAGEVARERANVDYWPAYEAATVTDRARAYEPDQAHITNAVAHEIVRAFTSAYGLRAELAQSDFDEKQYLAANPDVHAAVTDGRFASGYDHWVAFGRAEGRPLRSFA